MKYSKAQCVKALFLLLSFCMVSTFAHSQTLVHNSPDQESEYEVKEGTQMHQVLELMEQRYNIVFLYRTDAVDTKKVQKSFTFPGNVKDALKLLLDGQGLGFKYLNPKTYGIYTKKNKDPKQQSVTMQATISGTVTDSETGDTLPGANVSIQGSTVGSSTDSDGNYSIANVEPGTYIFVASFVGYEENSKEVTISEDQNEVTLNFSLQPSEMALEELVVVGYGQQERADVTGSISTVDGEDIQNKQTNNVAEALQGQSAGALITQSSGEPGAGGMDVMIRGASTIGSTQPLYVVDGVPIEGGISSINTSNIQSIEILKDASSAAIYGSRAANGVVMITTKSGSKDGDTQVQFSARSGISSIPENRRIDVMDTRDFYEFSMDALNSAGATIPPAWEEPNLSQNLEQNTDWQDKLFRRGMTQDYNLTVSGGSDNAIYSFSGGYLNEKGTVVSNTYEQISARIKSEYYIGDNDQLTIGGNFYLSQETENGNVGNDTFREIFQVSPTVPYRCPENLGGFCGPTNETSPNFRVPRPSLLQIRENEDIARQLIGKAYLNLSIIPNLEYNLNLSADLNIGEETSFIPRYNLIAQTNDIRQLALGRSNSNAYIIDNTLNYNFTFRRNNEFDVLVGFSQEKREYEDLGGTAQGFPSGELRTINSSTGQTTVTSGATASTLRSFFGRIQYNYGDRYQAQFSVRRDGSSRFGSNNRWGTFPSASVGWLLVNEDFMSQFDKLSNLKLRGSWGVTGSQLIPDFAAQSTVLPVANYVFGLSPQLNSGSAILEVGNSNLKWQETEQYNVGLDVGFYNQRLEFNFDYYQKYTSNVLLRPPVAVASGIRRDNGPFQNVGEITNSGYEFTGSYQKNFSGFSLQVAGNISFQSNEVQELGVDDIIVSLTDDTGNGKTITRPGSEVGAFYGFVADGIFNDQSEVDSHANQTGAEPGDIRFKDLNGDGVVDESDQTIIGSPFPDFFYGLNLNFDYKNFGLRVQMDGVQGRDILAMRSDNDPKGVNNATTKYLDRWTPNNRDASYPRATNGDPNSNFRSSTFKVEDGSYLALRNLTLSHNLGSSILSQWNNVRNLRIFLSATNLVWITSYDGYNPEIGASQSGNRASLTRSVDQGTYPIARTFEIGFDLSL